MKADGQFAARHWVKLSVIGQYVVGVFICPIKCCDAHWWRRLLEHNAFQIQLSRVD